jgi:hypothetical protein
MKSAPNKKCPEIPPTPLNVRQSPVIDSPVISSGILRKKMVAPFVSVTSISEETKSKILCYCHFYLFILCVDLVTFFFSKIDRQDEV